MERLQKGLVLGMIAGIIDLVPMIIQGLDWSADVSAFFFWMVAGFIISTSTLNLRGAVRGLVISCILLVPTSALIMRDTPLTILPVLGMTVVLGSALGYFMDRV